MSAKKIIPCIGSSDPEIREYVHDFGLCAMNIIWLECSLREHLRHLALLRSKWPLTVRKFRKKVGRFDETVLGGLVSEYEKFEPGSELAVGLRRLADSRGFLFHNRIQLSDPDAPGIRPDRLAEVRDMLQSLWRDAKERDKAVEKADHKVFVAIMQRIRVEQPSDPETMAETQRIIDLNGKRTENHPDA